MIVQEIPYGDKFNPVSQQIIFFRTTSTLILRDTPCFKLVFEVFRTRKSGCFGFEEIFLRNEGATSTFFSIFFYFLFVP